MGIFRSVVWFGCFLALLGAGCSSGDRAPAAASKACSSDAQCTTGHCDPKLGCVACVFDTQCSAGQRCEQSECVSRVPCNSKNDCKSAAAPACDPIAKECFACVADTDCKTGERCKGH